MREGAPSTQIISESTPFTHTQKKNDFIFISERAKLMWNIKTFNHHFEMLLM